MKWPWSRTNPDEQPIIWSASPGRYERHLKRRYRNLLFPSERRVVTQPEVDDARGLDQAELRDLRLRTRTSLEAFDSLSRAGDVAAGMHVIQSLEELWEACVAEGAEAIQCVPAIDELQRHISAAVAAALSDKPGVLAKFERAQELRKSIRARLASPIVLDLRRVPPEDLIYSLVSESPEVIVVFLWALSERPEAQTLLRAHGRKALADAVGEGYPKEEAAAKVRALGVEV